MKLIKKSLILIIVLCTLSIQCSIKAQTQINSPLVTNGNVVSYQISPDGSRVVYLADQDTDGKNELYSTSINGGLVVKLNSTFAHDGDIFDFSISPDGNRVIYRGEQDHQFRAELYSVSIIGGTNVKLNPDFNITSGYVRASPQITPDGNYVIFSANIDVFNEINLYSVPITGGTAIQLNPSFSSGGYAYGNFQICPNSNYLVYKGDQEGNGKEEIYKVDITGGNFLKLNAPLITNGDVNEFQLNSDGSILVYRADQEIDFEYNLYSVSITGGAVVKLNSPLASGINTVFFKITPDGNRVLYYESAFGLDQPVALKSVSINGGTVIELDSGFITNPSSSFYPKFEISPDSEYVVYRVRPDNLGWSSNFELYSVPVVGGTVTQLDLNNIPNSSVLEFEISPNSDRVVYRADESIHSHGPELYSIPISGGTNIELNLPFPMYSGSPSDYVRSFHICPNGEEVVYTAVQGTTYNTIELYGAPITGGNVTKLSPPILSGGDVLDFKLSSDNTKIIYYADQDIEDEFELYSISKDISTPVELEYFTVHSSQEGNLLNWNTLSELNNKGFEIQHSINAKNWRKIGFIEGHGTIIHPIEYNFLDSKPKKGINYYRLKQIDFDDSYTYSNTESVNNRLDSPDNIRIYPNPAKEVLNYSFSDLEQIEFIKIYGVDGRLNKFQYSNGKIDIKTLKNGAYIIEIKTFESIERQFFIKKE